MPAQRGSHQVRVSTVKEGEKYRLAGKRLREQADHQPDHAISEQFRKIADRYDELAEQVEATIRRAD
jgi:DNA-directed RNA polymerase subunit L